MTSLVPDAHGNLISGEVTIPESATVRGCRLENVSIGEKATVLHCCVEGTDTDPVSIGEEAHLFSCDLRVKNKSLKKSFAFGPFRVEATPTRIGSGVRLSHSLVVNSEVGDGTSGTHAAIRCSRVGKSNDLRSFSNVILSSTGEACNLGCEVSKTILGDAFVSEHASSYLSLVAPTSFPVLDAQGQPKELLLPNVTNIGAGTVFANYGGEPIPAESLNESPGSRKGTALVFSAFTAINSRIVNRYGQPDANADAHTLYRHPDLTVLGFASLVEIKATGRIPAFSRSTGAGPKGLRLGWVLRHKPGIVLTMVRKMKSRLGSEAHRVAELVEGTLRLEISILEEELTNLDRSSYSESQLRAGLETLKSNLDGRWAMTDTGDWKHSWSADEDGNWS